MGFKEHSVGRLPHPGVRKMTIIVVGLFSATGFAADTENGNVLFEKHCAACHTTIESVRDKSGPNLNSLLGRKAGTEDYESGYSEEMISSSVTWELRTIQAFLNSPALMVRGTKMVFRGLPEFEERLDIVCYLEQVTRDDDAVTDELCADDR